MTNLVSWNYLPHLFLLIAAIAVHGAPDFAVLAAVGLAAASAVYTEQLSWLGLAELTAMAGLLRLVTLNPRSGREWLYLAVALVGSVALSDFDLPGFRAAPVFNQITFTPDAVPFSMSFHLDKTIGGLLIALWITDERRYPGVKSTRFIVVSLTFIALVAAILPAAVWSGFVGFAPKWPDDGWIWMLNNLFFVCLAEEALYRGFLLEALLRVGRSGRAWTTFALGLSSVAFGVAHYRSGLANVILAAFAGVFYGFAYLRTRRIQSSMLVHFGLNLVHFGLFTYPAIRR